MINQYNCSICSATTFQESKYIKADKEVLPNQLDFTKILNCQNCGLGQAYPKVDQLTLDQFYSNGTYWEDVKTSTASRLHNKNQDKYRVAAVLPYLKKDRAIDTIKILDVGAGSGYIYYWLNRQLQNIDFNYSFIEPDKDKQMEILKVNDNKKIEITSLEQLEKETFDLIFLNHVIEHVADPMRFLRSIGESLKENGLIYIEVPNRDDKYKNSVFPHTYFFTGSSIIELVHRLNWTIVECNSFGSKKWMSNSDHRLSFFDRLTAYSYSFLSTPKTEKISEVINTFMYKYSATDDGAWIRCISRKKSNAN